MWQQKCSFLFAINSLTQVCPKVSDFSAPLNPWGQLVPLVNIHLSLKPGLTTPKVPHARSASTALLQSYTYQICSSSLFKDLRWAKGQERRSTRITIVPLGSLGNWDQQSIIPLTRKKDNVIERGGVRTKEKKYGTEVEMEEFTEENFHSVICRHIRRPKEQFNYG